MAKDLYDCIIHKQTVSYSDVKEYANKLFENDPKVIELLKSLFVDYVETAFMYNNIVVENSPTYADLDSKDKIEEEFDKLIDNDKLKIFINAKSKFKPYVYTDIDDPRNVKNIAENIAEARKLHAQVLRMEDVKKPL